MNTEDVLDIWKIQWRSGIAKRAIDCSSFEVENDT